jgi:hypothetical protein
MTADDLATAPAFHDRLLREFTSRFGTAPRLP